MYSSLLCSYSCRRLLEEQRATLRLHNEDATDLRHDPVRESMSRNRKSLCRRLLAKRLSVAARHLLQSEMYWGSTPTLEHCKVLHLSMQNGCRQRCSRCQEQE